MWLFSYQSTTQLTQAMWVKDPLIVILWGSRMVVGCCGYSSSHLRTCVWVVAWWLVLGWSRTWTWTHLCVDPFFLSNCFCLDLCHLTKQRVIMGVFLWVRWPNHFHTQGPCNNSLVGSSLAPWVIEYCQWLLFLPGTLRDKVSKFMTVAIRFELLSNFDGLQLGIN